MSGKGKTRKHNEEEDSQERSAKMQKAAAEAEAAKDALINGKMTALMQVVVQKNNNNENPFPLMTPPYCKVTEKIAASPDVDGSVHKLLVKRQEKLEGELAILLSGRDLEPAAPAVPPTQTSSL